MFKKGDIVGRISYNKDIIFIITEIKGRMAYLKGLYVRLVADSELSDLELIDKNILNRYKESKNEYEKNIISTYKKRIGHITGKILHFDSDAFYLTKCMNLYKTLGLYAYGVKLDEKILTKFERIQNGNMQQYILFGLIFLVLSIAGLVLFGG